MTGARAFLSDERIDERTLARAGAAEGRDDERCFESDSQRFKSGEQSSQQSPTTVERLPNGLAGSPLIQPT